MTTKPYEISQSEWDAWPNCPVPACRNKSCLRLKSKYCWPHTPGTPEQAIENLKETEPELFKQTEPALESSGYQDDGEIICKIAHYA